MGFEALATTSFGVANMLGRIRPTSADVLENIRAISAATSLPVNADLEDCYAADPKEAAKLIVQAAECGAVGGSIEDAVGDNQAGPEAAIYGFDLSVERVHAAVEAARALPDRFMLTARAEGLLYDADAFDDVIKRLQAFEAAGADVLYAPGLKTLDQIRTVVSSVGKPVNVVMGSADQSITLDQLSNAGVKRVSIGGGLNRVALQAFLDAATEMRDGGFGFIRNMASAKDLKAAFQD
jgi:2-methylisocitrate lyase-like PEP mutase family enzyme